MTWVTVEPLYKNTLHKNTLTKTSIFLCNSRHPKNLLLVNLPEYKNTLTKTSYILMKFGVPSIPYKLAYSTPLRYSTPSHIVPPLAEGRCKICMAHRPSYIVNPFAIVPPLREGICPARAT